MTKRKQRAVTIAGIAAETGLARSTVGFILNGQADERGIAEKTARRVRETAHRLDYVPNDVARSLRRRRTGVIGVVFAHLRHHWAERAVLGMRAVLGSCDYLPLITTHQFDPDWQRREIQTLLARQVEAIVCVPMIEGLDAYRPALERGVPLVFLNDYLNEMPEVSYAAWDAGGAARAAVRHLLDLGRRRIAYIGWDYPRPLLQATLGAYRRTVEEAGLESRKDWIIQLGLDDSPAERVARVFSRKNGKPDAILAGLDSYGVGALAALAALGVRVPDDVAIIGMGDQPGSDFPGVELSSMAIPAEEIGQAAAQIALELIRSPEKGAIHRLIEHLELKARRTTIGLPKSGPAIGAGETRGIFEKRRRP